MAERSEFRSQKEQDFSPLHIILTCSGTHPSYYPMVTGGHFLRGEAAEA
jgi:hypothetical protein